MQKSNEKGIVWIREKAMGRITKQQGNHKRNRRKLFGRRDLDQIKEELTSKGTDGVIQDHTVLNLELPGLGQFYCVCCDRYFISNETLTVHFRTKSHKRKQRCLEEEQPYTIREAEAAGGLASPR
eukprot:jgi/Galph1/1670/GphlegSOOS_G335.1